MADRLGGLGYRQGVLDSDALGQSNLRSGMGILQMQQLAQQMAAQNELRPLQIQQQQLALQLAQQKAAAMKAFADRTQGGGGVLAQGGALTPMGALATGAAGGDIGPTETNAGRIGMAAPQGVLQQGRIGYQPEDLVPLQAAGVDTGPYSKIWELANPKTEVHGGYAFNPRQLQHGQPLPSMTVTPAGQAVQTTIGPGGQPSIRPVPGAFETYGGFRSIDERLKAGLDPYTEEVDAQGRKIPQTRLEFADRRRAAGNTVLGPEPTDLTPEQLADYRKVRRSEEAGQQRGMGPSPAQAAANKEASTEFISEMRKNYAALRDSGAALNNIESAKATIPDAKAFQGPLGEQKLAVTKFMRSIGFDVNTEGVMGAEELRTRAFMGVMDNLKKMDAQPSQYQQIVMKDALGTLGTDPAALPKVLDVLGDIIREKVDTHNRTVEQAEGRGITFPHDVRVQVPPRKSGKGTVRRTGTLNGRKVIEYADGTVEYQ